jgi:plasmid stabilization system protein ParE
VTFRVRLTLEAEADLDRLFEFVLERELIIPFGRSGYVALFEIESATDVVVVAVRHQREDDFH